MQDAAALEASPRRMEGGTATQIAGKDAAMANEADAFSPERLLAQVEWVRRLELRVERAR